MITLNVEPGSKGSVTARARRSSSVAALKAFGLYVGRIAMARISPVRGSIATAIAALARVRRHAASTSFSARYWMVASMVRTRPCPATAGFSTIGAPLTSRPSASRSTTARPSTPARCASHACSMPARPLPSAPSKPMSWAASSRFGYSRRLSSTRVSDGSFSCWTARAMSGGRRRRTGANFRLTVSFRSSSRAGSPRIGARREANRGASPTFDGVT